MRASAFTLVGTDGTVLARLAPTAEGSVGRLALYDAVGTLRLAMSGAGQLVAYDQDAIRPAFRAGRAFTTTPNGPPFNGVELGPGGSISMAPPSP